MDKKNTTIGIVLLAAGFAWMLLAPRFTPPPPPAPEVAKSTGSPVTPGQPSQPAAPPTSPPDTAFAAVRRETEGARAVTLSNDVIEVRLTTAGGAVRDVALKKYQAKKDDPAPYVVNENHAEPALSFVRFPGLDAGTLYELVSSSPTEAVFRTVWESRIEVTRRYVLPTVQGGGADPYQIRHETTFRNLTAQTQALPRALLSAGTAAPLGPADATYLVTGHNIDGEIDFIDRGDLEGGGFLAFFGMASRAPVPQIETRGNLRWAAVNNQFFTSILTPDEPAAALISRRVELPPAAGVLTSTFGMNGAVEFNLPSLAPNAEGKVGMGLYVGPKDYHRLANVSVFKADQDKVMQFGMFKWFAQILLTLMVWMHSWTANWGIAIVLSTLALKIVFLLPTISASKSAKRMQKIQPELQAVREKYKDNPQKMQTETMALFKKYRVNPAGGCLPILLTMPFFFGFFQMLQSNTDLRFAEFLWAKDLSAPDTVFTIYGFPVNIMPLLLGATMIVQMRMVPTPAVDNMQMKMMKFMPWLFTLFCYSLPAGLSLYSTVNGLFTIGQQFVINRMKDDDPLPAAPTGKAGKPVKNVTPKKG